MHPAFNDLRIAVRRIGRRKPQAFLLFSTLLSSIYLSLSSWAVFGAVFLHQPDFDPNGTLYVVSQVAKDRGARERAFYPEVRAWEEQQRSFAEFGIYKQPRAMLMATPNGNERLSAAFLATDALRMLQALPMHGRLFVKDEDGVGSALSNLLNALSGLAIGLIIFALASPALSTLVYGLHVPTIHIDAVVTVLVLIAMLAASLPVRSRLRRIDPANSIRNI